LGGHLQIEVYPALKPERSSLQSDYGASSFYCWAYNLPGAVRGLLLSAARSRQLAAEYQTGVVTPIPGGIKVIEAITVMQRLSLSQRVALEDLFTSKRYRFQDWDERDSLAGVAENNSIPLPEAQTYIKRLEKLWSGHGRIYLFADNEAMKRYEPFADFRRGAEYLPRATFPIGLICRGKALLASPPTYNTVQLDQLREKAVEALLLGGDANAERDSIYLIHQGFAEFKRYGGVPKLHRSKT
jgi:hypothetical protein